MVTAVGLAFTIGGCVSGNFNYVRPANQSPAANSKTVEKSREAVWTALIPRLGKQFYVINNLDKSSGLVNVSYSGDPERYVDCGHITSSVKNLRGEQTYDFPGSRAQQVYWVWDKGIGILVAVDRKMSLEGRVNLVLEEVGPSSTRVTANTRYILRKTATMRNVENSSVGSLDESLNFDSAHGGSFSGGAKLECVATGQLENELLSLVD
jgi:hypothetical protein